MDRHDLMVLHMCDNISIQPKPLRSSSPAIHEPERVNLDCCTYHCKEMP